jgi:hypothetical protein
MSIQVKQLIRRRHDLGSGETYKNRIYLPYAQVPVGLSAMVGALFFGPILSNSSFRTSLLRFALQLRSAFPCPCLDLYQSYFYEYSIT